LKEIIILVMMIRVLLILWSNHVWRCIF